MLGGEVTDTAVCGVRICSVVPAWRWSNCRGKKTVLFQRKLYGQQFLRMRETGIVRNLVQPWDAGSLITSINTPGCSTTCVYLERNPFMRLSREESFLWCVWTGLWSPINSTTSRVDSTTVVSRFHLAWLNFLFFQQRTVLHTHTHAQSSCLSREEKDYRGYTLPEAVCCNPHPSEPF